MHIRSSYTSSPRHRHAKNVKPLYGTTQHMQNAFPPHLSLPIPNPPPPAHHPELLHTLFSSLALSTARAIFRRSRCRSACPFASIDGVAGAQESEDGGVSSFSDGGSECVGESTSETAALRGGAEPECAVRAGDGRGEYAGGMYFRMRPAAKTQPPMACRMRLSPARLPMMKTLGATSRDDSALARRVRPDIRGESSTSGLRISERREGER